MNNSKNVKYFLCVTQFEGHSRSLNSDKKVCLLNLKYYVKLYIFDLLDTVDENYFSLEDSFFITGNVILQLTPLCST